MARDGVHGHAMMCINSAPTAHGEYALAALTADWVEQPSGESTLRLRYWWKDGEVITVMDPEELRLVLATLLPDGDE